MAQDLRQKVANFTYLPLTIHLFLFIAWEKGCLDAVSPLWYPKGNHSGLFAVDGIPRAGYMHGNSGFICMGRRLSCGVPDYQLCAQQHVPVRKLRIQDFFHQQGPGLLPDLKSGLGDCGNGG